MNRLRNCGIAAGLASLAFAAGPAWANTVEEPGETSGIAAYAPLPEGGYFLNLGNFGVRTTHPNTGLGVDIPALVWSTPVTFLGARLEFLVAQPVIDLNINKTASIYGVYYPFVQPILTWDLGGGLSFGGGVGAYLPIRNSVTKAVVGRITTVRFNAGINYIDKDWTLAATGAFGLPEGTDNENPAGHHQWALLDLTANYSIGKWQVGLGGYGSIDTSEPPGVTGYKQQAQFAVGPLVGYNFGPVILQAKLTRDVTQQNEGGFDTRFWTNLIIPLWGAPPPPPPVTGAPPPPPPAVEAPPTRTYLVFFDWDRADLSSRAQQIIGEAASASTRVHVTRIMCNGYTDTSGTAKYNLALSMRRANNVANELVKDGVPRDVIDIKGFGETHPLVQTGPGVREPQNRRVEIILG
jgi:outer membrane protein OmpA-like peptidoglycan-associated protein